MPRITVTTDPQAHPGSPATFLDERVRSTHLSTGHSAAQLVERLAWAILDAEDSEAQRRRQALTPSKPVKVHAKALRIWRARPLAAAQDIRS